MVESASFTVLFDSCPKGATMTTHDKRQIEDLFQQLHQMAGESLPRDPQAEALIWEQLQRQPAAPYYMAQLLLLQKQSLATARQQIDELHRQRAQSGHAVRDPADAVDPISTGISFLTGAAQAALAIGGGLLLADFVVDSVDAIFGNEVTMPADEADMLTGGESWI
jgi:uncharacterized protein